MGLQHWICYIPCITRKEKRANITITRRLEHRAQNIGISTIGISTVTLGHNVYSLLVYHPQPNRSNMKLLQGGIFFTSGNISPPHHSSKTMLNVTIMASHIPDSTTTQRIYNNKENEQDNVCFSNSAPVFVYVFQDSSFTWIATETQFSTVCLIEGAIFTVWWSWASIPICRIYGSASASCRRFATSRLKEQSQPSRVIKLALLHNLLENDWIPILKAQILSMHTDTHT